MEAMEEGHCFCNVGWLIVVRIAVHETEHAPITMVEVEHETKLAVIEARARKFQPTAHARFHE
jgi:hypothetical protein